MRAGRRRVGYIAYQGAALGEQLLKVQDTIPICPPQLSQHLALGAVAAGRPWVAERVAAIAGNRREPLPSFGSPCAVPSPHMQLPCTFRRRCCRLALDTQERGHYRRH